MEMSKKHLPGAQHRYQFSGEEIGEFEFTFDDGYLFIKCKGKNLRIYLRGIAFNLITTPIRQNGTMQLYKIPIGTMMNGMSPY